MSKPPTDFRARMRAAFERGRQNAQVHMGTLPDEAAEGPHNHVMSLLAGGRLPQEQAYLAWACNRTGCLRLEPFETGPVEAMAELYREYVAAGVRVKRL